MALIRVARVVVVAGLAVWGATGEAFAQTSTDSYFNFLMGRQLESDGNATGALAALERAAAADPKSAEVRAEIASLQYRRNLRDEAEKAAKTALTLDSANVEANRILGLVYAANAEGERRTPAEVAGFVRNAITHLERALQGAEGPPDPTLNFTLGRMYLASSEPAKAAKALEQVVSQNPYSVTGRLLLAQAYAAAKDLKSAIAVLDEIKDDEPRVLAPLADYQRSAGQVSESLATYNKALEAQPNSAPLKARRIVAMYESKLYSQAAAAAADAQRQHPDNPDFPRLQASALLKTGETPRAIEILEASIKAFPKDSRSQLALADVYSDAGRTVDAERILRAMIAADPSDADALNYLGYMLARNRKDLDEAIRLVSRALQVRPGEGAYLDSLGWAHFQRGDLNEAEKYLGAAVASLPQHSEILDHLGDLHARQGRWQDAIAAWTRALNGDGTGIEPATVQKKIEDARGKAVPR